jgi:glycosyltransferase involved in cell wall biosynthesis
MSADTLVFIPAWNEEASIPAVVAEARRDLAGADVLVIDDGSTDATARAAADSGALVISFPENRGLRHGIAEGYRRALDGGYAFCGRLDADGQHPAAGRMSAMSRWARVSCPSPGGRASATGPPRSASSGPRCSAS